MIHLVLGGARSGKSRYAEALVHEFHQQGFDACYVATAKALDSEMTARIAAHQTGRHDDGIDWQVFEEPLALSALLKRIAQPKRVILVDCLTLWLTNQLLEHNTSEEAQPTESNFLDDINAKDKTQAQQLKHWHTEKAALLATFEHIEGAVILVSNEVGSGIVPLGELSRQFVDQAGWLNQALANQADKVTLVVAGLPLALKS